MHGDFALGKEETFVNFISHIEVMGFKFRTEFQITVSGISYREQISIVKDTRDINPCFLVMVSQEKMTKCTQNVPPGRKASYVKSIGSVL